MAKKPLRRITMLVTPQTEYNLRKLAMIAHMPIGRIVDKLVRDRMICLGAEKAEKEGKRCE